MEGAENPEPTSISQLLQCGVVQSRSSQKPHLKAEARGALQLLARSPRGAIEDVLELGYGYSRETPATLRLARLAKLVTEMLRVEEGRFPIERLQITDAGRRAIRG
jgi:hypothetical protein